MKKVFLVYGHYNDKSFNSAIKDNFIKSAKENGHLVECVDLYKEKFDPVYAGENADDIVLDHRRKIDDSDLIVLVAPIWNYRMPAIVEGWIDKVLAPPWAFSFKKLFGNYGYAVGKLKKFLMNLISIILKTNVLSKNIKNYFKNLTQFFQYLKINEKSIFGVWTL